MKHTAKKSFYPPRTVLRHQSNRLCINRFLFLHQPGDDGTAEGLPSLRRAFSNHLAINKSTRASIQQQWCDLWQVNSSTPTSVPVSAFLLFPNRVQIWLAKPMRCPSFRPPWASRPNRRLTKTSPDREKGASAPMFSISAFDVVGLWLRSRSRKSLQKPLLT